MDQYRGFTNPARESVRRARQEAATYGQEAQRRRVAQAGAVTAACQKDVLAEVSSVTTVYFTCEYHACEATAKAG